MHRLRYTLIAALCTFALGCSDSTDRRAGVPPEPPSPPPVTDLDATGVYEGRIVTDGGDLALVTFTLARDGTTAVAIQTDDSGEASRVLWGETRAAAGDLDFEGSDSLDGSSVALTFTVDNGELSSEFRLSGLTGTAEASLAPYALRESAPGGLFSRQDSLGGLTSLDISGETISVTAPCSGGGTLATPDTEVNVHRLTLDEDCLGWEALGSVTTLEGGTRVLQLSGKAGLSTRLYQP